MEFIDTLECRVIIALYVIAPIIIFIGFCIFFCDKGIKKALIFSFCAVGSYFPIFKTVVNEATDVGQTISKITKLDAEITECVVGIIIGIAVIISWVGCIDAAYQLLFPKKEKQNIKQKETTRRPTRRRKKRH